MHRSLLLAAALGCACTTLPGGERVHRIRAHWAGSTCKPAGTSRTFDLDALGDFPPSIDTSEELEGRKALVVPAATRGVEMIFHDGFSTYLGLGESAAEHDDIDVALWPAAAPCPLDTVLTGCDYPGTSASSSPAVGVSADGRTLVVAGGDDASAAKGALSVDLATGAVTCAAGSRGMQLARSEAKVAPFGKKLLVSGGYDPLKGNVRGTAEVFDPQTNRFDPELVALNGERAHHAAVTLASGEVLLVGGVEGRTPLDSLEVLVPETNLHRADVTTLPGPRVDPLALRLSDGRIFVGGGTEDLGGGSPVPDLVWLSANATSIDRQLVTLACPVDPGADATQDPPPFTVGSAFAAMPGGAVLAVGGCTLAAAGGTPLKCAVPCDGQPLGCPSSEIFWIDRDANVACCGSGRTQCGDNAGGALPWTHPVLVPGADGTPWLLEGAPGSRRFHRFDPWAGQFGTAVSVAGADPLAVMAADRGLFLWVEGAAAGTPFTVQGFRHGVRGPYTQAVAPLLLAGGDGIVPDRAPSPPNATTGRPWRDPRGGAVELPPGAELVVTDTTYADVSVVVHVVSGPPPDVRLGDASFGRAPCRWPRARAPFDAQLTRTGTTVTLTIDGNSTSCSGPVGRVSLAVAARTDAVTLSSVDVTRLAPR